MRVIFRPEFKSTSTGLSMDTVKADPGSDPLLISDECQIKEELSVSVKEEDDAEVKLETENEVIIEDHQLEDLKSSDTANSHDSGYNEIVSTDQHEVSCHEGGSRYMKEPRFNILEPPDIDFTVEKCYACERCHRKFTTWAALKSHSTNVHCNNKPFKCNLCQRTFMYYGSFKLHSGCRSAEKPHRCEICDKKYKYLGSLEIHARSHDRQTMSYECELCQRKFTRRYNLKMHSSVHTGKKPHSCHHCGARFSTQSNLKRHRKRNRCRVNIGR